MRNRMTLIIALTAGLIGPMAAAQGPADQPTFRFRRLSGECQLRIKPAIIHSAAIAGLVCAIAIFLISTGTDWRPYTMVAGWGLAGVLYWLWQARRQRTSVPNPKLQTDKLPL
jgi:hypothetical protein